MTSGYLSSRSRIFSDIREGLNWGTSEGGERRVPQEARRHLGSVTPVLDSSSSPGPASPGWAGGAPLALASVDMKLSACWNHGSCTNRT